MPILLQKPIGQKLEHGSYYMMQGPKFQETYHHFLDAEDTCCKGRLSLTFRVTAPYGLSSQCKDEAKILMDGKSYLHYHPSVCKEVSFDMLMNEFGSKLEHDTTTMFKKTHLNNGRLSGEFLDCRLPLWEEPHRFNYKYAGRSHVGQSMGDLMIELLEIVYLITKQRFDWCHVVYYPTGFCKIGAHGDKENTIYSGSNIACLSIHEDPFEFRTIKFRNAPLSKDLKEVKKAKKSSNVVKKRKLK